ncbi:MAG: hypothetical protein ACJ8EB_05485 [Allosphingosinicella sp.]
MPSTKRRINSTGRRRIPHDRVSVALLPHEPDGIPRARATVNLDGFEFPESAAIVFEAYQRMTTNMRFDCGTAVEPKIPDTLVLNEIDPSAPVLFRLKVVDHEENPGRLLGTADRLRPDTDDAPDSRNSLFPIELKELHSEIWKVDMSEGPTLLLNYNIPNLTSLIQKNPLVQGLMLPAALRVVLESIVQDPSFEEDEEEAWKARWLRFCREELNLGDDPSDCEDDDARRAWVDEGVRSFCRSYSFITEIKKSLEGLP